MQTLYLHRPFQHPELHPLGEIISLPKRDRSVYYEACRKELCDRYGDETLGTFLAKRIAAQARKLRWLALCGWEVAEVTTSPQAARERVLEGRVTTFDRIHWGKPLTYREPDGAVREFIFAFFEQD